jgi:hypothetical protein
MRFVCLGYMDESKWEAMSQGERDELFDECIAYGEELGRGGHVLHGQLLERSRNGVSLRHQDGRVTVTDGPFAETKEQLAGFSTFEARDLNHAIQLMSGSPGLRMGHFEIRAVDEALTAGKS